MSMPLEKQDIHGHSEGLHRDLHGRLEGLHRHLQGQQNRRIHSEDFLTGQVSRTQRHCIFQTQPNCRIRPASGTTFVTLCQSSRIERKIFGQ
jgi:5-methylcytosine-specific restriction endonuclease McrA